MGLLIGEQRKIRELISLSTAMEELILLVDGIDEGYWFKECLPEGIQESVYHKVKNITDRYKEDMKMIEEDLEDM